MKNELLHLLVDGKNAFPEIIDAIENAKTSIEINMFIWRDDEIGNKIANSILKAANKGVKVYISVDRYGVVLEKCEESQKSFFHKKQTIIEKIEIYLLQLMYQKNGKFMQVKDEYSSLYTKIINHPNIQINADEFKEDHSKYYIIDKEILFIGGINIEDKENGADIIGRQYGDYMVKIIGNDYVDAFYHKLKTGLKTTNDIFYGINIKKPMHYFEMEQLYLDMIHNAKNTLHITMAYFSPLQNFMDAIIDAHKRGVNISILIPENANFQNDSNHCMIYKLLKATNNEINVYLSPKMLHTKLMMNESYISLGSTNITKKAFHQLNELNVFVKRNNSKFTQDLVSSINNEISLSKKITKYDDISYNRWIAFIESMFV